MKQHLAATPRDPGLFLALAPMDGVTDWVYRDLLTSMYGGQSGISQCVSEFVRVTNAAVPKKVIARYSPEIEWGGKTRAGVPVFVQILGGRPGPMGATAAIIAEAGAPGVDINFGCPAKTVNNHDGGASILKAPCRVEDITRAVVEGVGGRIPVSVKIRLGWENADAVEDIARAAEQGGAAWLTIHARTRTQGYKPPVDWRSIGRARQAVTMPVIANGDLYTVEDVRRCGEESGCTGFMIGRGSMGRPNLFRQVRGVDDDHFQLSTFVAILEDYAERLLSAGASERAALGRTKQWLRMAAPTRAVLGELFDAVKRVQTLQEARILLRAPDSCRAAPAFLPEAQMSSPAHG